MKIVADLQIPHVNEAFARFGGVALYPGREITPGDVQDADILLVRSVTRVDNTLLADSPVQFVASATSGIDHVDVDYLKGRGIGFASAPGCNARPVAEYVLTALLRLARQQGVPLAGRRVGIIGYGHVGSRVARFLHALGVHCVINDPPLAGQRNDGLFEPLESALACDVVTLHVPLTESGPHATRDLLDRRRIESLADGTVIINTARGGILDENALLDELRAGRLHAVIDVWQNEPTINPELLAAVHTGTPHIAGYSLDGRLRAVDRIYMECCAWFKQQPDFHLPHPPVRKITPGDHMASLEETIAALVEAVYPIADDDAALREMLTMDDVSQRADYFDQLRRNYPERREFSSVCVQADDISPATLGVLESLGFAVCPP